MYGSAMEETFDPEEETRKALGLLQANREEAEQTTGALERLEVAAWLSEREARRALETQALARHGRFCCPFAFSAFFSF